MVCYIKKGKDMVVATIDGELEKQVLEEAKDYKIVKVRTITWERLDDDRSGSDFDVFEYPLADQDKSELDYCLVIKDNHFFGVNIHFIKTDSWNAGLNKETTRLGCSLFIDGTTKGSVSSKSTYDSPNNYDEVETTYKLKKIN